MEQTQTQSRAVFRVSGADAKDFLQGLVTNDVKGLADGLVYAALLTPQGKYLSDFFLVPDGEDVLLDCPAEHAADLQKRLTMYKLRAKVTLELTDMAVARGLGEAPESAFADPRSPDLGWRQYGVGLGESADTTAELEAKRIALGVPASGIELIPNDTYVLEAGFERLKGVDFRKGCFVGQEIVARMKHKTELRKGLARVQVDGEAPVGTEIMRDGKTVGKLFSQADGQGIAHLRFDRAGDGMTADGVPVRLMAEE
ncbi:MAG: folate-binding protein [Pseudomonadota bacterium]